MFGWQARPDQAGVDRCYQAGLSGYIGQAENQAEYEACLGLTIPAGYPHALVGNVGGWWNSEQVKAKGWELIIELYENTQPGLWDRLDSKGYPVASVLYGCNDEGSRVQLSQYRTRYPASSWSVYLAEEMNELDWNTRV